MHNLIFTFIIVLLIVMTIFFIKYFISLNYQAKQLVMIREFEQKFIHNIRTPLAAIQVGVLGVKEYLPLLIECYHKATGADLIHHRLLPQQLTALAAALDHSHQAVQQASLCVDSFSQRLKSLE